MGLVRTEPYLSQRTRRKHPIIFRYPCWRLDHGTMLWLEYSIQNIKRIRQLLNSIQANDICEVMHRVVIQLSLCGGAPLRLSNMICVRCVRPTLPNPTLPYPTPTLTLPYPTLPYAYPILPYLTLPYAYAYPTLPYHTTTLLLPALPTLPYPAQSFPCPFVPYPAPP